MATHSSTLALKIPWEAAADGVAKSRTRLSDFTSLQCPVVCLCHVFIIHSSVDGYLGCFHALAVMKSAAMSACILLNYSFIQIYA